MIGIEEQLEDRLDMNQRGAMLPKISIVPEKQNRFDIHNVLQKAESGSQDEIKSDSHLSYSRYKTVPSGEVIGEVRQGEFQDFLKPGDWSIEKKGGRDYYYEILIVNKRTVIVEIETMNKNRQIVRKSSKKKFVNGAIIVQSENE